MIGKAFLRVLDDTSGIGGEFKAFRHWPLLGGKDIRARFDGRQYSGQSLFPGGLENGASMKREQAY